MLGANEALLLGCNFLKAFRARLKCANKSASCKSSRPLSQVITVERTAETMRTPACRSDNAFTEIPKATTNEKKTTAEHRVRAEDEERCIERFLQQELPKFASLQRVTTIVEHKIVIKDDRTLKLRYTTRNPAMQAVINAEVNKLIANGQIDPARSPYSSPITLARKKNGT